jgi:hypothetical protein
VVQNDLYQSQNLKFGNINLNLTGQNLLLMKKYFSKVITP